VSFMTDWERLIVERSTKDDQTLNSIIAELSTLKKVANKIENDQITKKAAWPDIIWAKRW